jgi:UDP-N-acetylglucosamine--N-acetylmuramyl-(pentapeptide) pyrophosphoryl-undecaprenol N-acetylglucosamine transferase
MAARNAAIHLPQSELTAERLADLLQTTTRESCRNMAQAAYENGRRDANESIANVLEKLVESTITA